MANRLTWIVFALGIALYGMWAKPLVLGLDLRGGVTMRYELEPPTEVADPNALNDMIESTAETLRNRINAYGIRESNITRQGEREILVELPGSSKEEAESVKGLVSRVGRLEFRIVMWDAYRDQKKIEDDVRNGIVMATEVERLGELLAQEGNAARPPADLDLSPLEHRIDDQDIVYRWYPVSDEILLSNRGINDRLSADEIAQEIVKRPLTTSDFALVKIDRNPARSFSGADIANAMMTQDQRGNPAVGVDIRGDRSAAFGDWTEPNVGRSIGILLDGRLAQHPATINERLDDHFVISSGRAAGFSPEEIKSYLTVIKSGSLQMKPRLLFENTVGPSLGESSIKAGIEAAVAGFLIVLVFMLVYYRMNGVVAGICLLANMVMLTGVLMFLGATLTLPGIAGLVLTLGMAVDANILIFERMREEADRAKSIGQAVKLGYEKAFSTIMDANVTTFVTGFILFKVGSGPVRGFAVILMLGIATSVFSVLVIGRVISDWMVDRGIENLSMARFVAQDTRIAFMSKARLALKISTVAVVASLVAFFMAGRDKYGLDFLGGYKAQVVLDAPASQGDVTAAVAATFPDAQIISVLDDVSPPGTSTQFVIKVKAGTSEAETEAEGDQIEELYANPLKGALAGRLLPEFVTDLSLQEDAAALATDIRATLNFAKSDDPARAPTPEKVAARLAFLSGLTTAAAPGGGVSVSGRWARAELDEETVIQRLLVAVKDAGDLPAPSEPFLESTTIGASVGTELRDSAIRAILLSFIAIVLYIRVRFREYRYGWAAIVALFHDVSITLGVVALMHFTSLVEVEIDLAMIAAFLTIIGYSLNDTIVIFDRVRENLPRMTGKSLSEVIDISVNQTLSRTLLTSLTTLLALIVIFIFNYGQHNVLEGFSFAMILGVVVGTYSTVFVASPVLLMLPEGHRHAAPARKEKTSAAAPGVPT